MPDKKMPSSKSTVTELKAPEKKTKAKAPGLVAVKNIGTTKLSLAGGPVAPGEKGEASQAELSVLHQYLEKA